MKLMSNKPKLEMTHFYTNYLLFPITSEAQEVATIPHFASTYKIKYRNPLSG
jgi:hypothetical protein